MSRTKRNVHPDQYESLFWDWERVFTSEPYLRSCFIDGIISNYLTWHRKSIYIKVPITPSKKDLALCGADGKAYKFGCFANKSHRWYKNQVSRKQRNVDKQLINNLYRCEDYDDFDYDDSETVAKRKGLWWDIY